MPSPGSRSLLLLLLAACGGGGGSGAPIANEARLVAEDIVLQPGATSAVVEIELEGPVSEAALLQFTLTFDPTRLGPASGRAIVEERQPVSTVDAEEVEDGNLAVICGDARNRRAQVLREGALLRLHLDTRPPRAAGTTTIEIRDFLLVDGAGTELAAASAPVPVQVTFR